jgi:hypothetical protein
VADQHGRGAVAVSRRRAYPAVKKVKIVIDFVVHELKGDLFPGLMEYMG